MADYKMNMQGVQIAWLGHATFKITSPQGKVILIDPWTQKNPACPPKWKKIDKVDLMLVTHGHFDHIGDAVEIAKATKPTVVTIVELAGWLQSKGVDRLIGIGKEISKQESLFLKNTRPDSVGKNVLLPWLVWFCFPSIVTAQGCFPAIVWIA